MSKATTSTKRKLWNWWHLHLPISIGIVIVISFFAINWCYHVFRKPSELVGLVDNRFYKSPRQTWEAYGNDFQTYSTSIISPELLAALAQTETRGNSIARTYWHWNTAPRGLFEIYAPASSAVGLFQITDGTFEAAKKYCVRAGYVLEEGPWYDLRSCWFNKLYNRLIPSHSIQMTAAYLHVNVLDVMRKTNSGIATKTQKQDLAAVIHLCGIKKGEEFAKHKFKLSGAEHCGNFRPRTYLTRVQKYKTLFWRLKNSPGPLMAGHTHRVPTSEGISDEEDF